MRLLSQKQEHSPDAVDSGGTRGVGTAASKSGSRPAVSLTCRIYGRGGACEMTGYGRRGDGEFDLDICCCTFQVQSSVIHSVSVGQGLATSTPQQAQSSAQLLSTQSARTQLAGGPQHKQTRNTRMLDGHNSARELRGSCSLQCSGGPSTRASLGSWAAPKHLHSTALHAKAAALRAATSGQIQTSRSAQSCGQRTRSRSLLTSSAAYLHWRLAKRGGL